MELTPEEARNKAAATYNSASDFYDHAANTFWARYGRSTVERLALTKGQRVLDVCCGSGASAIPAAELVGPTGSVTGVDLADKLLELARRKAKQSGLENIEFRSGDLTQLPFDEGSFDVAVCVFGIFFVPDMDAALRELKRVLRPGGRLAITTWGPRFFEPPTQLSGTLCATSDRIYTKALTRGIAFPRLMRSARYSPPQGLVRLKWLLSRILNPSTHRMTGGPWSWAPATAARSNC